MMNAPDVVSSRRVTLEEISTASDAGWRDKDPEYIQSLINAFQNGEYGFTQLTAPSILQDPWLVYAPMFVVCCRRIWDYRFGAAAEPDTAAASSGACGCCCCCCGGGGGGGGGDGVGGGGVCWRRG